MDEEPELTAGVTPASTGRGVAAVPGFGELQPAAAASLVQAWRWPSQRPQDGAGTPRRNRRQKGSSSLPPAGRAPTNTHPPVRAHALALLGEHPPYLPSPGWAAPLGLCAPFPRSLRGADCGGGGRCRPSPARVSGGPAGAQPWAGAHPAARQPVPLAGRSAALAHVSLGHPTPNPCPGG